MFSCWFHRCDRFFENSLGKRVFSDVGLLCFIVFFQFFCLHEFVHLFSSLFEWCFDVVSCFWEGFSLPGDARVVVFPQEYECFGQNPAPLKTALFFHVVFMLFHVCFMFLGRFCAARGCPGSGFSSGV